MRLAFLDRDGVINKEVNYLHRISDFKYTHRCIDGLRIIATLGYKLAIVTNQAGIAKGIFTEEQYKTLTEWMLNDLKNNGVEILECLYCPNHPDGKIKKYSIKCEFRKPGTKMLETIQSRHNIDMEKSILIGDKISDIHAANNAGVGRAFLVKSGHPIDPDQLVNAEFDLADDLYSVAKLLSHSS